MTDPTHLSARPWLQRPTLRRGAMIALILLLILAVLFGYWHKLDGGAHQTGELTPSGSGQWVTVVERPLSASIELSGILGPANVAVVNAPFDGSIEQLAVAFGQSVQAGQVLFGVTSLDMQARHNEAFAHATRTRNTLNELRQWESGWQMAQAKQAVERASAALERAGKKREQLAVLLEKGIAAAGELNDAMVELQAAKDALTQAQQQLAQEARKASPQELQLAASNHQAAAALYQHLSSRLALASVRAPKNGMLVRIPGAKPLANGLKVGPDEALIGVWDGQGYLVRTQIDQRDLKHVQVGQGAVVQVGAIARQMSGKVTHIAFESSLDSTGQAQGSSKYELEIRVTPDAALQSGLRIGMSVAINLPQASFERALSVPLAAIRKSEVAGVSSMSGQGAGVTDGDANSLLKRANAQPLQSTVLVRQQGRAVLRAVQTGLTTADSVQIVAGLKNGEQVWVVFE